MEIKTANEFTKKVTALKHCNKVLNEINRKGHTTVKLNCTGITFTITKCDAMYYSFLETQAKLNAEISSLMLIKNNTAQYRETESGQFEFSELPEKEETTPATAEVSPITGLPYARGQHLSDAEKAELKKEQQRIYTQRWLQKRAAQSSPLN